MRNRKGIFKGIIIASMLIVTNVGYAITFSGNATPTVYNVTLKSVSLHKSGTASDAFLPYASGSGLYDIAAANPGSPVGTLQSTNELTSGFYDQMQFQVARSMTVKSAYSGLLSNNLPCRTVANGSVITDPAGDGSISSASLGSTDGGTPEEETIVVPTGTGVTLPAGYVFSGSNIQGTVPVSITATNSVPSIKAAFNVTNSIMFVAFGATQCLVIPGPPSISITSG